MRLDGVLIAIRTLLVLL